MIRLFYRGAFLLGFSLVFIMFAWSTGFISETTDKVTAWASCSAQARVSAPIPTSHFSRQNPASIKPLLTWTKVEGAVAYEVEILNKPSQNPDKPASYSSIFYTTNKVYVNGYNADLFGYFKSDTFYWRVRGLDVNRRPISSFSEAQEVYFDRRQDFVQKPIITSVFNQGPGATLLYPVYAWIPIAGATKYEVEILDDLPENPNDIEPSVHRIDSAIAVGFDYYDQAPRMSENPFYWRVRGLDEEGNPVGVYSDAGRFSVNPTDHVDVVTYGDSITHGGGSVSYSPADWEYSYQHYLDFPTINLGRSGDTSQTMVERFDQDVLPFHPQYLIIMGGSNSLRGGVTAEDVISDLKQLKEKCLANDIRPVFLTLPSINPDNIKKVFDQPTAPGWQTQRRLVNDFIRTQVYVDVAYEMKSANGILPTRLAVDGLHVDIEGKKKIASAINKNWARITALPWENDQTL